MSLQDRGAVRYSGRISTRATVGSIPTTVFRSLMVTNHIEVKCDEHGKHLVPVRRADGEGGGWNEILCPVCKEEEKLRQREEERMKSKYG
jgi:hypothetical protein